MSHAQLKFQGTAALLIALVCNPLGSQISSEIQFGPGVNNLAKDIAKHTASQGKARIAVLPFRQLGANQSVLSEYVAEQLTTDLVNIGGLDIVERSEIDKVVGELKFDESGAVDPATAKEVGRLVGADAIVIGTIADLRTHIGINCRMIDAQTGKIFAAASTSIVKDDDVRAAIGDSSSTSDVPSRSTTARSSPNQIEPSLRPPEFVTNAFRLVANKAERVGSDLTITVTLEAVSDQTVPIYCYNCYVLDENGERWDVQGADSGHFMQDTVRLVPGTKFKSRFLFAAKGVSSGSKYSFICLQNKPVGQSGMWHVILPNIQ